MAERRESLTDAADRLALMASQALEQSLCPPGGERPDTKSARDLSAIMKDMAAISRDSRCADRQVTVTMSGGAGELAV